ncbi:CLUMA_CG000036, isoform A [Clunio marinus]|uniref:CLUMA_CG000036, isoform A n=1 Tax=Clunio marinus TaxID=568069 RepID=A0A1J1HDW8_9DIPT|nr:CLUMA_CG000036, isoform A [Clunio marinus]
MKIVCKILLILKCILVVHTHIIGSASSEVIGGRNPKWFPFYSIGRFAQDTCVGTNKLIGTCTLALQCSDIGGTTTGATACSQANTRQASCCIVTKTCGSSADYNNTYFVNSGYPQTFPGGSRCDIRVTRLGSDVCQLRIDFLEFTLAQPTGDGLCSSDYFGVSGGSSPVPRICGENSGQHVYVDFSGDHPITITVATSSSVSFNRRWHFHLQQIGCDSPSKAPSGCLQYWMDKSGYVSSFNYASAASGSTNSIGVQGSRQIASLSYGACVKAAPGTCSITWSRPTGDAFAFTVTGDVGAIDPAILGTAAVQEQMCTTDYVTIPSAQQNGVDALGGDRFCGLGIDDTTSISRPYVIYTKTNANEMTDIGNRGWYLTYTQNMCPV